MKKSIISFLVVLVLHLWSPFSAEAAKVTVPLTDNGAWSYNSQPNAVYYNGKTYFAWINSNKALMAASYDHATGETKEQLVSTGYTGDFCSPGITVRNGQILLFASENKTEAGFYCWSSTNLEDISAWSSSQKQTGYGISSTIPFMMNNDLAVFWRSKNNIGYSFYKNVATSTSVLPAPKRAGFLGTSINNNYAHRDEVPLMLAHQGADGSIHMVITHFGTGLTYTNSTVHYARVNINAAATDLEFKKADGSTLTGMNASNTGSPLDTIAKSFGLNKVRAYDITSDAQNNPIVLYDTLSSSQDALTTAHTYFIARWNGTEWKHAKIVDAGDGLSFSAYKAVDGKNFTANSYQAGGLCFAPNDPSTIYLSKKSESGAFELYRYQTTDEGKTWTMAEAVTSGTPANEVNIRPIATRNAPSDYPMDIFWMRGTYANPTDYSTSILCAGEGAATTGLFFAKETYEFVANETVELPVRFAPLFALDKAFTLESSNTTVVEITSDGKLLCKGVGEAIVTAKLTNNTTITTTCKIVVVGQPVYVTFMERIIEDIRAGRLAGIEAADASIDSFLSQLTEAGSFPDINYASTDRTDWEPLKHIDRMLTMGFAYTHTGSKYKDDAALKAKLDKMLSFWLTTAPNSANWYNNEIGEPQRMGQYLTLIQQLGSEKVPADLFTKSIARLKNKGGNPGGQTGANRVDVALHWMYRACLTSDPDLLKEAMDYIYSTVFYTTGAEGIQYDNSYTQHGRQLHIGSYGDVFLAGVTKACRYAAGTSYAIQGDQLTALSGLANDTYLSAIRGEYISYNVIGRASTRPGATRKSGGSSIIETMKELDPSNIQAYDNALLRLKGTESPSFGITPKSTHYYCSDYTLHQRPAYMVDLRMVSTRTARNEYLKDNGEGVKQYFMSDGAMGIHVKGNEYYNIFPTWNYAKVPGVTCPEFVDIPQASTYIKMGQSGFVGGVTDSLHTVSVYKYTDKDSQFGVNSSANKAWFFFDKEIVCLGNSIESTSEFQVNTTVNQCLLDGSVIASSAGTASTLAAGSYDYTNNLDWVLHGNVGYFFPQKGNMQMTFGAKTGNWYDINTNYTNEAVTNNVFTLSFNHGLKPTNANYSYIIVPGMSTQEEATAYATDNIEMIINSDSVQAVYHKELKTFGIVFYRSSSFKKHGLEVEADAGCAVLIKDADKQNIVVHVSDPTNGTNDIKLAVGSTLLPERRQITYRGVSPHTGRSMKFVVNASTPLSTGRDVLANRSDWSVTTSLQGPADQTPEVGGDNPLYIIDESTISSFLFVKPGKTFSGVTAPADYVPSFTIDMKSPQNFEFIVYRHRDYNNVLEYLRAKSISLYGKNAENEAFEPIQENITLLTASAENKIALPTKVTYRYIKVGITEYDTAQGSTIQISDFAIGKKVLLDIPESGAPTALHPLPNANAGLVASLFPNPVRRGDNLRLVLPEGSANVHYELTDIAGKVCQRGTSTTINTASLSSGIYLVRVINQDTMLEKTLKIVVR